MSQSERTGEPGWSVVPPQADGSVRLPERSPERAPSRSERREQARSMVGLLAGALAGQVEQIARTADDEAPEGWWFTPSQHTS